MLRTEFEGSTSENGIRTIGLSGLLDYQDYWTIRTIRTIRTIGLSGLLDYQDYWTIRTIRTIGLSGLSGLLDYQDYQDYWTIRTIGLSGLSGLLDYQDYWTIRTIRTIGLLCENKLLCNYAQFWWIAMLVFECVQELAPIEIGQKKCIVYSHNAFNV